MVLLGLFLLTIAQVVRADLTASYPVNAQLPPVARVSEPFKFVFSEGTFGGTDEGKEYSLDGAPSWLHVDSDARTLSGTPKSEDVGHPKFKLKAKCPSGSADMEVTLAVSDKDGPQPGKPLLQQLEKAGPTSASATPTFFVRPGDSFSISFDRDTFENTENNTVFYGTSPENSPLPSWMNFEPSALKFSGKSPSGGSQSFTFNLIASDIVGFSAVTLSFEMAVAPHILSFNDTLQTFSPTKGEKFESPSFHDFLTLDGQNPSEDDLTDISLDAPDWLTLDNKTFTLSGTPPKNARNENATISVTDTNEDVAKMIISLRYSELFMDDVTGCDATIGEDFSCNLAKTALADSSFDLEVDLNNQPSWLHYDADDKTLHGHVPNDTSPQKYTFDLTATDGTDEDTRKFTVDIAEAGHHDHSTDDTATANGTKDGNSSEVTNSKRKSGIIAAAVIIPTIFVASIIGLLVFCWRRRRRGTDSNSSGDFPTEKAPLSGPNAPGPLPNCNPPEETAPGPTNDSSRSPSPSSEAPKLELKSFFDAKTFEKTDSLMPTQPTEDASAADKENARPRSTAGFGLTPVQSNSGAGEQTAEAEKAPTPNKRLSFQTSPSIKRSSTGQSKRREPLKPIQGRRSLKRNSATSSRSKRNSKRSSGLSSVASGLPVRLSGAGHGAGGFGPPANAGSRLSWQNGRASMQGDEHGLGNLAPLFPRPPPRTRESLEYSRRASIRAMNRNNSTISESDSLEEFVHTRAKSRNSTNPMFSGQNTRRNSGLRALERKRSTLSRADTESTANFTIYQQDDQQDQMQNRPYSTARSASVYTDADNRQSTWIRPMSTMSQVQPSMSALPHGTSQISLAQRYRDVISPLPQFNTQASLGGQARQAEEYDFYQKPAVNPRSSSCYDWRPYSSTVPEELAMSLGGLRKSPSLPLDRMGSVRSTAADADKENNPESVSSRTWRTMSPEDSREFPRDQTGSSYQAFL